MRRNVRQQTANWESDQRDAGMEDIFASSSEFVDIMQLSNRSSNGHAKQPRYDNTLEVKVQEGDTLQALALRFHCTVADIKRLNKIDRENEIHAHRILRIPVTVHNVLLGADTLPTVHRSGNNSPRHNVESQSPVERNPLEDARLMLDERLLVAAVNASGVEQPTSSSVAEVGANVEAIADEQTSLLEDMLVDRHVPRLRPIPGPSLRAFDWGGSDCDMSWICLFIFILALCFVIPLVYVIYLAEHPHHNHTS
ncbi:lysM and putative peptidoglycan-binding domain-containing protein 3 isoform X2 [Drosophila busckii]|uniref:lysM and putative peptidoglycan-binding domain-containing protein 3 isoform X2 n=1 Tax=Drosophila busckii TaxID=30019 RepID=UPI00083F42CA|nr:lysM and putative peptidoglycan-binding domain-containing protein 3 isoform X2 [Drosophila busckii]